MDRSINMTVGEKIKFFRTQLGITQKELAERCDVVESTIRNYELGKRYPDYNMLNSLAEALGVSYYSLAEPQLNAAAGVLHCMFTLEQLYGLKPVKHEDKIYLEITDETYSGAVLKPMLTRWETILQMLNNGEITQEDYEHWCDRFPHGYENVRESVQYNDTDIDATLKALGIPPITGKVLKMAQKMANRRNQK